MLPLPSPLAPVATALSISLAYGVGFFSSYPQWMVGVVEKVTRPKEDLDIVVYPVWFKVEMEKAKLTEYFVWIISVYNRTNEGFKPFLWSLILFLWKHFLFKALLSTTTEKIFGTSSSFHVK